MAEGASKIYVALFGYGQITQADDETIPKKQRGL